MKETSQKEGKEEGHLHSSDGVAPDLTGIETLSVTPRHEARELTSLIEDSTKQDCLNSGD